MAVLSISKAISARDVRNGGVVTGVQANGDYQIGPTGINTTAFKISPPSEQNFDAMEIRYRTRWDDPTYYG